MVVEVADCFLQLTEFRDGQEESAYNGVGNEQDGGYFPPGFLHIGKSQAEHIVE
jgi:hypothetical protein